VFIRGELVRVQLATEETLILAEPSGRHSKFPRLIVCPWRGCQENNGPRMNADFRGNPSRRNSNAVNGRYWDILFVFQFFG
jgi:hypothetical protein